MQIQQLLHGDGCPRWILPVVLGALARLGRAVAAAAVAGDVAVGDEVAVLRGMGQHLSGEKYESQLG